jgi:hypothetical protein
MIEKTIPDTVISWEEFVEKYKPIHNHLDHNACYDGFMFEAYGDEVLYVYKIVREKPFNVWTIIVEDGNPCVEFIANGAWPVNRLGYIITENPFLVNPGERKHRRGSDQHHVLREDNVLDVVEG